MIRYGGRFCCLLGQLIHAAEADPQNLARIKATWPVFWDLYSSAEWRARTRDMEWQGALEAAVKTATEGLREDLRQLSDACDGYIIELQRTAGVEKERDQLKAELERLKERG